MTAPARFCCCAHRKHPDGERPEGGCPSRACGCTEYRESPVPVTPPTLEFDPAKFAAREKAG